MTGKVDWEFKLEIRSGSSGRQ